jgi:hypothetical protein
VGIQHGEGRVMGQDTKFTPGPWFTTTNKPHRVCVDHGTIVAHATMPPAKMNKTAWQKAKETAHANAHLISASPDMYEAMPDLSHVITWLENGCCPKQAAQKLRIYANIIEAAKAKARGEQ